MIKLKFSHLKKIQFEVNVPFLAAYVGISIKAKHRLYSVKTTMFMLKLQAFFLSKMFVVADQQGAHCPFCCTEVAVGCVNMTLPSGSVSLKTVA